MPPDVRQRVHGVFIVTGAGLNALDAGRDELALAPRPSPTSMRRIVAFLNLHCYIVWHDYSVCEFDSRTRVLGESRYYLDTASERVFCYGDVASILRSDKSWRCEMRVSESERLLLCSGPGSVVILMQ